MVAGLWGLTPSALAALISGGLGLILKSNLLLILAVLLFAVPFLMTVSISPLILFAGLIFIIFIIGGKRK